MLHRLGWALSGALAIITVLALARALEAGPLDPPGPVSSTMRTLDELTPSWDQKLTGISTNTCHSQRFECVLPDATHPDGAAVLDHETGLVWQRAPSNAGLSWFDAFNACDSATSGGRSGWRLPAIEELTSLFLGDDPGPFQFQVGTSLFYWSSTKRAGGDGIPRVLAADFSSDSVGYGFADPGSTGAAAWCVRGGGHSSSTPSIAN